MQCISVIDRRRRHFDRNNSAARGRVNAAPLLLGAAVVRDDEVDVVEEVVHARLVVVRVNGATLVQAGGGVAAVAHETAHGEAGAAVLAVVLERVAPGDGHVVDDPVVLVGEAHALLERHQATVALRVAARVRLGARHATLHVLEELYGVGAGADAFAKDDLAEVLHRRLGFVALAKVKVVVLEGDDGLFRVEAVHVEEDLCLEWRGVGEKSDFI